MTHHPGDVGSRGGFAAHVVVIRTPLADPDRLTELLVVVDELADVSARATEAERVGEQRQAVLRRHALPVRMHADGIERAHIDTDKPAWDAAGQPWPDDEGARKGRAKRRDHLVNLGRGSDPATGVQLTIWLIADLEGVEAG